MFLSEQSNNKEIEEILLHTNNVNCAVAFIGEKAEDLFKNVKSGRVVCNLDSGCTNPETIKHLQENTKIEIRNNPKLHAKVYISEQAVIISSSNLSANGLGYEGDEITGWIECGYKIDSKTEILKINTWFRTLWDNSKVITENDLLNAQSQWEKRRKNRPQRTNNNSFSTRVHDQDNSLFNRKIFFAITYETMSNEALAKSNELEEDSSGPINFIYEDWDDLPEDSYLINIHISTKNRLEFLGLCKSPEKKKLVSYTLENKEVKNLFICYLINEIDNIKVTKTDIMKLSNNIKNFLKEKKLPNEAYYFSVDELIDSMSKLNIG